MKRALTRSDFLFLALGLCTAGCPEQAATLFLEASVAPADAGPKPDAGDAGDAAVLADAAALGDATSAVSVGDASTADVVTFPATPGESARAQDTREFTYVPDMARFDALPGVTVETDRFFGTYEGGAYRIEIPKTGWNGKLVVYAHGYVGPVPALRITTPSIRKHLIEKGYAWAASSYSRNYYDVRAGVEDTNKLVLDFVKIAKQNGRDVAEPSKRYIIGHSMGGHITAAAIEKETADTAINKVAYDAALPMCGVMGDTDLFNYFAGYQIVAQHLAGTPATAWPVADFANQKMALQTAVFSMYPKMLTEVGNKVRNAVMNMTGGKRPVFELGFAGMAGQDAVWNTFGGDGTVNGILEKNVNDTRMIMFQLDDDPALSADEMTLNAAIFRVTPAPDANAPRPKGLRFIPKVNGEISIKVLSMHTLGDLYVPFKMQQIYRQRVEAKGNADKLVQRAIRGVSHCEFSYAETTAAFEALIAWAEGGAKPDGDDVLDPALVGNANYGCKFTQSTFSADETMAGTLPAARAMIPACPAPAP
jgi:pimeloyl-ACP methyl ester carboxylesterase